MDQKRKAITLPEYLRIHSQGKNGAFYQFFFSSSVTPPRPTHRISSLSANCPVCDGCKYCHPELMGEEMALETVQPTHGLKTRNAFTLYPTVGFTSREENNKCVITVQFFFSNSPAPPIVPHRSVHTVQPAMVETLAPSPSKPRCIPIPVTPQRLLPFLFLLSPPRPHRLAALTQADDWDRSSAPRPRTHVLSRPRARSLDSQRICCYCCCCCGRWSRRTPRRRFSPRCLQHPL